MGWDILAPIIAREGIEAAFYIWSQWQLKQDPTQEDWDKLRTLKTASQIYAEVKERVTGGGPG